MSKIIFILILFGCSQISEVQEFEIEARNRVCSYLPTTIHFTQFLKPKTAGYCLPGFGVFINKKYWDDYGKYQRLELIFHEMGHCGLGYHHSDTDGIMSPTMHSENEIEASWAIWVDEFFENCN